MVGDRRVPRVNHDLWAFDRSFSRAAIARPDGAVDVFDITASAARIDQRIPSTPQLRGLPTSLVVQPNAAKSSLFIATASQGGQILIRDRVVSRLESCVTALQLAESSIFACDSASKNVVVLDAENGEKLSSHSVSTEHVGNLSALAVASDASTFVVCSQRVSVHEAESGKMMKTFAGHQSPIATAAYFSNNTRVVTGSKDDAHVFIWDLSDVVNSSAEEPAKKRRKRRRMSSTQHATHTLMAPEQGIRQIAVSEGEDGVYCFAALLKSGVVALWRNWKTTFKQRMSQPDCTIYPCEEGSSDEAASVHCIGFHSNDSLKIVYGPNLRPQVFSVSLDAAKMKVYLPKPAQDNLLVNHSKALRDGQVVGIESDAVAAAKAEAKASEAVGSVPLNNEGSTRRRKRGSFQPNDETSVDTDEEEAEEGQPLAERLKALGVSVKPASAVRAEGDEVDALQKALAEDANSKRTVLLQALRAEDDQLLDTVLCRKHPESVITTTVRKLPAEMATGRLLTVIDNKLRNNPEHTQRLVPWLKEVITEHSNSLTGTRNESLSAISQHVKSRLELATPLMRLQGRLELVTRRAQRAREQKENSLANAKPKLELIEKIDDGIVDEGGDEAVSDSDSNEEESSDEEVDGGESDSESDDENDSGTRKVGNGSLGAHDGEDSDSVANGRPEFDVNNDSE